MAQTQRRRHRISFTAEEDNLLRRLVEIHGPNAWEAVAQNMIGRTQRQCRERWRSYLMPTLRNGPWTKEEDDMLVSLVQIYRNRWVTISKFFHGRSDSNVKNRWYTHIARAGSPASSVQQSPQEELAPRTVFLAVQEVPEVGKEVDFFQDQGDFDDLDLFGDFGISQMEI